MLNMVFLLKKRSYFSDNSNHSLESITIHKKGPIKLGFLQTVIAI